MALNGARNWFFEEIGKQMEKHDIYIVSADLAGPPFDYIRKEYPERYVAVGIAEQNMISVACGLALSGKKVIAYTANPFIALRAFDQVRNAVALMNLPITIVGYGTGFSISSYGTTHFITEDFAMMTLCPGLKIITITDNAVAEKALKYVFSQSHAPCYLRFDKDCSELVGNETIELEKGWRILKKGDSTAIIGQGYSSKIAYEAAIKTEFPAVIDIFGYPFDENSLIEELVSYKKIIVIEEQQSRGGLSSMILEVMNDKGMSIPIIRMGVEYEGGLPEVYGSRTYWLNHYGIDVPHLIEKIKE